LSRKALRPLASPAILVGIYFAVVLFFPRTSAIGPEGRRLLGIFTAAIFGLILQPIPGGALVLIALTLATLFGGLTIQRALAGYSDPIVWLVLAAFFISNALLGTGLARRIALLFVRLFGTSSLGVCYSLGLTDFVLAFIIPASGARSGGVVLPIVRSVAELYDSRPGPTAGRLGAFLMIGVYEAVCVTSATLLTGQASNVIASRLSSEFLHYQITWASWFRAGIVPGLLSLAVVPWIVYRLYPPLIRHTPEAAAFARRELDKMGPMSRAEWIVCAVFVAVCGMWIFTSLDAAVPPLLGSGVLLITGALNWHDVTGDRVAWDVFIWYGGLFQLAKSLGEAGVTQVFAKSIGSGFAGLGMEAFFVAALLVYFYAHYGFASVTAHILALYPAFAAVMLAKGVPPGLAAFSLGCFGNLCAALTNYGTTPAPMFFAHGYVPFGTWWRIGFITSFVTLSIWGTIGFAWWKMIGIW